MLNLFARKLKNSTMNKEIEDYLIQNRVTGTIKKAQTPLLDDRDIKRVEIIVLKYKSPEMEQDCVSRIIRYTQWPYKLNIFDNRGNGPNTAKAWNKLIRESTCDYILFIDSDAFIHNTIKERNRHPMPNGICWLTEMMKAFDMYDNVAFVGPTCGTLAVSTVQSMRPEDQDPFCVEGHLSGYCFLTKKSIYEEVGYFDEDFCFYGQESDWIEILKERNVYEKKNYKLVVVPRAHVIHGYDNHGSLAAKQAVEEDNLDIGEDSAYSYYCWNMKKKQRMEKYGVEYKIGEYHK